MWYSRGINAMLPQSVNQTCHGWLNWWTQSEPKASGQNKGMHSGEILLFEGRDVAAEISSWDPQGAQKAWLTTDQIIFPAHTHKIRACKIGQALKSDLLGNDKNGLIKRRTIGVLIRPVFLWSGTLHCLPDIPKGHNSCNTERYLVPLAVFLTHCTPRNLHSQAWRMFLSHFAWWWMLPFFMVSESSEICNACIHSDACSSEIQRLTSWHCFKLSVYVIFMFFLPFNLTDPNIMRLFK